MPSKTALTAGRFRPNSKKFALTFAAISRRRAVQARGDLGATVFDRLGVERCSVDLGVPREVLGVEQARSLLQGARDCSLAEPAAV